MRNAGGVYVEDLSLGFGCRTDGSNRNAFRAAPRFISATLVGKTWKRDREGKKGRKKKEKKAISFKNIFVWGNIRSLS